MQENHSTLGVTISLSSKIVLITGGTRGIGKAIADKYLSAGASVILTGTKKSEIDLLNEKSQSDNIRYMYADFSIPDSVSSFLTEIGKLEKIDVLINNAGINKINLNTETSEEDYDLLDDINLKAPYLLCREVSKIMKRNGYGRIINITSIWSTITRSGRSLYTATKWGLVGLTKTLAVELAPYDILVNAVAPGFTMTELTATTNSEEELHKIADIIPIKRPAQPDEIASLVLFLGSNLNTYITAQNITIDGGYTNV